MKGITLVFLFFVLLFCIFMLIYSIYSWDVASIPTIIGSALGGGLIIYTIKNRKDIQ